MISNSLDTIGNSGLLTAENKGVSGFFNNCVAILSTIIYCIAFCYNNGGQRVAIRKSRIAYTCDTFGNSDGFQQIAICKGLISNTRHTIRDCDRSQRGYTCESSRVYTYDTIGNSFVSLSINPNSPSSLICIVS